MRRAALAVLAATMLTTAARADITFTLRDVTLATSLAGGAPAGTLTGSFTTNDARSAVIAFNITASAAGSFLGFTYTPATAITTAMVLPSQYFQLDSAGSVNELRLYFASGLGASGGVLAPAFSYENEPSGGTRYVTGSVAVAAAPTSAVPEPASWAMMVAGFGAAGAALRGRRRPAARLA